MGCSHAKCRRCGDGICYPIAKYRCTAISINDGTKTAEQIKRWGRRVESHPIMKYAVAGTVVPENQRTICPGGWVSTSVAKKGAPPAGQRKSSDYVWCQYYSFVACDQCIEPEFKTILTHFPEGWVDGGITISDTGPWPEQIEL